MGRSQSMFRLDCERTMEREGRQRTTYLEPAVDKANCGRRTIMGLQYFCRAEGPKSQSYNVHFM